MLSDSEIVSASRIAQAAGADIVKTSTGFSMGGATAAHVALMRRTVGSATRIGASASMAIVGRGPAGDGY